MSTRNRQVNSLTCPADLVTSDWTTQLGLHISNLSVALEYQASCQEIHAIPMNIFNPFHILLSSSLWGSFIIVFSMNDSLLDGRFYLWALICDLLQGRATRGNVSMSQLPSPPYTQFVWNKQHSTTIRLP